MRSCSCDRARALGIGGCIPIVLATSCASRKTSRLIAPQSIRPVRRRDGGGLQQDPPETDRPHPPGRRPMADRPGGSRVLPTPNPPLHLSSNR